MSEHLFEQASTGHVSAGLRQVDDGRPDTPGDERDSLARRRGRPGAAAAISVLVATYNRAALLEDCLAHLERQRFEPGDEIIVVDNGSTDGTRRVIERAAARFPVLVRYVHEAAPGKSRALARGLAVATGDVFAFTDDDVNVAHDWIEAIRDAMRDPTIALAGGPVTPRWEGEPPRWLQRRGRQYGRLAAPLALLDYGPEPADLGSRTLLGANLAIRADVIRRLGGYSSHLGKLRGTLLSGEDHELCLRVQAAGFRARYCPAIRAAHWVPADRARCRYVLSWFFWLGITTSVLDDDAKIRGREIAGVPLYLIRRFLRGIAGAPAAVLTGRTAEALDRAVDGAFAAGYAARRFGLVRIGSAAVPAGDTGARPLSGSGHP